TKMSVFYFQAEDGIRDFHVTGVQTCALPISPKMWCGPSLGRSDERSLKPVGSASDRWDQRRTDGISVGPASSGSDQQGGRGLVRSEERRGGNEGKSLRSPSE